MEEPALIRMGNLGTNFTQKDVAEFLGLTDEDFSSGIDFEQRRDDDDDSNYCLSLPVLRKFGN